MKITAVDVTSCLMPKDDPNWRFALGANPVTEGSVVAISCDDGTIGYGYASATAHIGASPEGIRAALDRFVPVLIGKDAFDIELILRDLDRNLAGNNQAKAAIDCALYDAMAKSLRVPLYKLFGGKVRSRVPILRILAIKKPHEMAAAAQKLADKGYNYFKIKVHGDVAEDVACVKAIREQVGAGAHLTIDANQSYTPKNAITALNRMAEFDIDLCEQPVKVDDMRGLKLVTDSVPVTIEADEAGGSLNDVMTLVMNRAVDAVSLKIPRLGGLRNTMAAARVCEAGGIRYRFGAAVGSRLLSATGMHLAAALPGVDYACEFGEFDRLLDDPFEGIEIDNGHLTVTETIGAGVTLRQSTKRATAGATR